MCGTTFRCQCGDTCLMMVKQQCSRGKAWGRVPLSSPPVCAHPHVTAKDLIHKLLNPDPIERYTIDEALAHSWLRGVVSCLFHGSGW